MPLDRKKQQLRCDACGRLITTWSDEENKDSFVHHTPNPRIVEGLSVRIEEKIVDLCRVYYREALPYVCSPQCEILCYLEGQKMKYMPENWSFTREGLENRLVLFMDENGTICEYLKDLN